MRRLAATWVFLSSLTAAPAAWAQAGAQVEPGARDLGAGAPLGTARPNEIVAGETLTLRQAFEAARAATDREIEKRATFQLGNVAVREGKLEEALDHYTRALEIDPEYEDAKVNREYVVRKIKELLRKKKEQAEKQKAERRVVEKLQELVARQTALHGETRIVMRALGKDVPPTRVRELEDVLTLPGEKPEAGEEALEGAAERAGDVQAAILEDTRALLEEIRAKIETPAPQGPGQGASLENVEALKKALPFVVAAEPAMARAEEKARAADWVAAHVGQEEALIQLLKALDVLLDELTRLIRDEVQLLKDTARTRARAESPDPAEALSAERTRDEALQLRDAQGAIEERTRRFAEGLEQHLQAVREQAKAAGGPAPGEDPEEATRRFETAVSHLGLALDHMTSAGDALAEPDLAAAMDAEQAAVRELVAARNALNPPQSGQQNEEEKKGDESSEPQGDEKNETKEKSGEDDAAETPRSGEGGEDEKQDRENEVKMSPEQARKMLERARQRERDKRKRDREAMQRRGGRSSGVRKDW